MFYYWNLQLICASCSDYHIVTTEPKKIHPVPSLDKCESCTRNRLGQQEHGLGAVYNMHHPHEGRKTQQHCIHSQDLVTAEGRER